MELRIEVDGAMHDWTLKTLNVDWKTGELRASLESPRGPREIVASNLKDIHVGRVHPWGESISINSVVGPTAQQDGLTRLSIEIQSGDLIEILAENFEMPVMVG